MIFMLPFVLTQDVFTALSKGLAATKLLVVRRATYLLDAPFSSNKIMQLHLMVLRCEMVPPVVQCLIGPLCLLSSLFFSISLWQDRAACGGMFPGAVNVRFISMFQLGELY